jgi:hypothetical protein
VQRSPPPAGYAQEPPTREARNAVRHVTAARATDDAAATLTNERCKGGWAMYIGIGTVLAIVLIVLLLLYVF